MVIDHRLAGGLSQPPATASQPQPSTRNRLHDAACGLPIRLASSWRGRSVLDAIL